MKRARVLVVAVVMAVPVVGAATPAHACAGSWVCDTVNRVCHCIPN